MALPAAPNQLSFSDFNTDRGLSPTTQIDIDTAAIAYGIPDKPHGMDEFRGRALVQFDEYGNPIPAGVGGLSAGGGGCLAYGTQVLMYDGSYKNVEDLIIGDIVKSIVILGLQSSKESAWETFRTDVFNYEESLSIVYNIYDSSFNQYYLINNTLKATYEHPIFIKRNNEYFFTKTENLLVGDYVFKSNNKLEMITSIILIEDTIQTININIEENDVYFGDNILVHNVGEK